MPAKQGAKLAARTAKKAESKLQRNRHRKERKDNERTARWSGKAQTA